MKKHRFYSCPLIAGIAAIVAAMLAPTAQAQEIAQAQGIHGGSILHHSGAQTGGEFIVGQQVVSDSVSSHSEYVGDLSTSDAGIEYADSGIDGMGIGGMGRSYGQPDLFYNHFTQGYNNRSNAQMYVSPLPVPPNVGHTFYTYQPFYPEELLYWHKDRYHSHYDNGRGMNRTRAVYYSPPVRQAASNLYWNFLRIPR